MKTIKILALIFCLSIATNTNAQNQNKNIIKVSYTAGCVSEFLVGMLKKQVKDPKQYSDLLIKMNDYKIYSSFYQNIKTKESIYVVDSIQEVQKLSTTGYTYYTYKGKEGSFFGKESFMGKDIDFTGETKNMNWVVVDEQKEINGYPCKKAHLKGNEKVYVWFSPAIPVNGGPYIFHGLPGLVLESDSYFESINANTIAYQGNDEFLSKLAEVKEKINYDKSISIEEVFAKKENFQRMVEKGK